MEKNNLNSERKSLIKAVENTDIPVIGIHKKRIGFISEYRVYDDGSVIATISIDKQKGDICDILQKGKKTAGR